MADFTITSKAPTFFLAGELDIGTVPIMTDAIEDAVSLGGPITLDLSKLTFVDSSGVGAILGALGDLPSGCIVLHGADNGIQRVLDIMGVGQAENLHIIPCTVEV